jgi:hypothetical protein
MNENNLEPRNVHDSSHHTHSWTIISLKMELRLIKHILSPCNHLVVDDNQTTAMHGEIKLQLSNMGISKPENGS